jgi:hypothetical protein
VQAVSVVRATQPSWAKCQLKPACALYFPAIGILRLDAPHDMLLVCEAGEFVILFMLPGVYILGGVSLPSRRLSMPVPLSMRSYIRRA